MESKNKKFWGINEHSNYICFSYVYTNQERINA